MRERTRLIDSFARQPLAAKVPEIGALFWVVKLFTTAGGEATSDFLGNQSRLVGAVVEIGFFALAMAWQLRTRRYFAPAYWSAAFSIAIFGTGASDTLHLAIGIPYAGTTVLWAVVLALVFWLWERSEHTLSIHSINTTRRELYYWAVVFSTFALGTAVGDFSATSLNLGFLTSGVLFGVVFLVPLVAWARDIKPVLAFWAAYVLTRPLGASFSDYVSKPRNIGGIDFGDLSTAIVSWVAVAALVAYLALSRHDIQTQQEQVGPVPATQLGAGRRPHPWGEGPEAALEVET